MNLKLRLQRLLQIVEDTERAGAISDLERDMILGELRAAYSEVRFGGGVAPIAEPTAQKPTVQEEPQKSETVEEVVEKSVEVPVEESVEVPVEKSVEVSVEESVEVSVEESVEVPVEESVEVPVEKSVEVSVEESVEVSKEKTPNLPNLPNDPNDTNAPNNPTTRPELEALRSRRSTLLSLYDDEPKAVIGEQFHEKPSVADTIACQKGVAESTPVTSLRKAIGVADRFMLIRELFDGDSEAYERAIDALEKQTSFDDCVIYISENFAWRAQSEGTKSIMSLLQRKFNE